MHRCSCMKTKERIIPISGWFNDTDHKQVSLTRYGYLGVFNVSFHTSVGHDGLHLTPIMSRVLTRHIRSADHQLQEWQARISCFAYNLRIHRGHNPKERTSVVVNIKSELSNIFFLPKYDFISTVLNFEKKSCLADETIYFYIAIFFRL